ncbi:hypothetical protein [Streptomyces sp. NPDC050504]|uniref:hypothetical protein n=1 Tax=Streptomyces sp. NPDC050504 TaxID=3365618 RepID=UPI00378B9A48
MEHRVRLTGTPHAASELACLRVIARLPSHWFSEILECGTGYAVLGLHTDASDKDVTEKVDAALTASALRDWVRD